MSGAEAVRKEFEAWFRSKYYTVDPIAEATIWAAWQAARSAAIQECVAATRCYKCEAEIAALKER